MESRHPEKGSLNVQIIIVKLTMPVVFLLTCFKCTVMYMYLCASDSVLLLDVQYTVT